MFKKIYIETTNHCNINCSFCKTNVREKLFLPLNDFNIILNRIKGYTEYIYLHVLGEPLLNTNIDKYIMSAKNESIKVNITTNGTLLKERTKVLLGSGNIHQINISLHCEYESIMSSDEYFENIIEFIKPASEKIYINLRLWDENNISISEKNKSIINYLIKALDSDIPFAEDKYTRNKAIRLKKNIFLHLDKKFIWPSIDGDEIFFHGLCYALKDQIAILCDGTVVPCCLDGDGALALGNIFENKLDYILNSERAINIKKNFQNKKIIEKYCRTCGFGIRNNS